MKELIRDILTSMQSNRQRIKLTGLSIAWGIFILIVLLGVGNSTVNGVTETYFNESANVAVLTPGTTSMSYGGYGKDRTIVLTRSQATQIAEIMSDDIIRTFPEKTIAGQLSYEGEWCNRQIWGEIPGYICTFDQHIEYGRDLSEADVKNMRKVCVISHNTARLLFGAADTAVGSTLKIQGIPFKVVGVYVTNRTYIVNNDVFIPFETMHELFSPRDKLDNVRYKLNEMDTEEDCAQFDTRLRETASQIVSCSSQDIKAFKITNMYADFITLSRSLDGLVFFIWFIGIATLISGIVGVSNIMTITVKERTREFGVLRAMGAKSRYIISIVLGEAVMVTLSFGYIGLMLGIGVTQLFSAVLSTIEKGPDNIFGDPALGLGVVTAVTVVIVLSGLVAGLMPARRAVKMKLIDALTTI